MLGELAPVYHSLTLEVSFIAKDVNRSSDSILLYALESPPATYQASLLCDHTQIDLVTLDLSFISILAVLPAVKGLLSQQGVLLTLIKPQFEAPREQVGIHLWGSAAVSETELTLRSLVAVPSPLLG